MHKPYLIEIQPLGSRLKPDSSDLVFQRIKGWQRSSPNDFCTFDFFELLAMRRQNRYALRIWRDLYSRDKLLVRLRTLFPPDVAPRVTVDGGEVCSGPMPPGYLPVTGLRHRAAAIERVRSLAARPIVGVQLEMNQLLHKLEETKSLAMNSCTRAVQALSMGNAAAARVQLRNLATVLEALGVPVQAMIQALDQENAAKVR